MSSTKRSNVATLTVGALLAGVVGVALSASPARADSDAKRGEVEGIVADKTGTCPNLTFTVLGTKITTNESTKFEDGNCNDLANGKKVEVKVPLQPTNGAYGAAKVEFNK